MWRCAVCGKNNREKAEAEAEAKAEAKAEACAVCGRERGHVPASAAALPFHPSCRTVQGAQRFLDVRHVESLLRAGVDPDTADSAGWTGLHWAVALSRFDVMQLLIEHGADVVAQRADGATPLHVACELGDEDATLFLLQRGADPDLQDAANQYSPAHVAAQHGHKACLEALGLAAADLNVVAGPSGCTPVMVAALAGQYECVASLLIVAKDPMRLCQLALKTLDVNVRDIDGFSALDLALLRGHQHIADLLHSNGAVQTAGSLLVARKQNNKW